MSLPLYFKLIPLDSYPHRASNIFQKNNVQSQFLVLYRKERVPNRQWTSPFFSWSLVAFVCYCIFFSTILSRFENRRTLRLRKNKTKVAKGEQRIWLLNQSNRSIDLNQLTSVKRGNTSSLFCDEGNISRCSLELESKEATEQPKE